jgi:hypothetical protein
MQPNETAARSSLPMLIISWLIVGIPAAWGVSQTFTRSLQLFTAPLTPPAATSPSR